MISDLRTILEGWDYEPGKISVRRIVGRDGHEKIQTRIDLGVLQLETEGRPDGRRPHGYESLLEYHERRLRQHVELRGDDEDFYLSPEECRDLRHEAYLYYQRYISQFVLEEFDGVERDTAHNLRIVTLTVRYAATDADRVSMERQHGYVLMMHTRARAYLALAEERHDDALALVDEGLNGIELVTPSDEPDLYAGELNTLRALRDEVLDRMPLDSRARLESELRLALEFEEYERAARLRDELARLPGTSRPRPRRRLAASGPA